MKKRKHAHSTHRAKAAAQAAREAVSADLSVWGRNSRQRRPASEARRAPVSPPARWRLRPRLPRPRSPVTSRITRAAIGSWKIWPVAGRARSPTTRRTAWSGWGAASATPTTATAAKFEDRQRCDDRRDRGQAEALPELLQTGATSYVYGPSGRPIEQITGGAATFLQSDQRGSIRLRPTRAAQSSVATTTTHGATSPNTRAALQVTCNLMAS